MFLDFKQKKIINNHNLKRGLIPSSLTPRFSEKQAALIKQL